LRTVCFHNEEVQHWGLAISPDGKTIAAAGRTYEWTGVIKVWSLESESPRLMFDINVPGVCALAFSPDGTTLASGSKDGTMCLWNVSSGAQIARLATGFGMVRALAFSPDGQHLTAGYENGNVQTMNAASLETVARLKPHGGPAIQVFYSPDGTKLYSASAWGNDQQLTRVHDLANDPPTVVSELRGFHATDISPDGRWLVGGWGSNIRIWDIEAGKEAWRFPAHVGGIIDIKFTPDGTRVISVSQEERTAIMWDLASRQALIRAPHFYELIGIARSASNNGTWATLSDDGTVKVWELYPRADVDTIREKKRIESMVVMSDGSSVMLGGDFPTKTWDLSAETQHEIPRSVSSMRSATSDGRWLVSIEIVPNKNPLLHVWDLSSNKPARVIPTVDSWVPIAVEISPDGKYLAACGPDLALPVYIWDLSREGTNDLKPSSISFFHPQDGDECYCRHLVFSPDSRWLALAYKYGLVNLYNLQTKQMVPIPTLRSPWSSRVAFSRDGRLLAAGNKLGVTFVFDTNAAKMIATFAGHEGAIAALSFFPDSRTLAVGSLDTIRLWDIPSKQERIALNITSASNPNASIKLKDLAVSSDGKVLLSRQGNGTVRVWKAARVFGSYETKTDEQAVWIPNGAGDTLSHADQAIVHAGLGQWDQAISEIQLAESQGAEWDIIMLRRLILALPPEISFDSADGGPNGVNQLWKHAAAIVLQNQDAELLNGLVWYFALGGTTNQAVADFVVQIAEKAASLAPTDRNIRIAPGIACYRAGNWQAAIEALESSLSIDDKDATSTEAHGTFFLAMAHHQLGHATEARTWYDRAVARTAQHASRDWQLRPFHKEAMELLGPALTAEANAEKRD
jgi:WD40 repeat protein